MNELPIGCGKVWECRTQAPHQQAEQALEWYDDQWIEGDGITRDNFHMFVLKLLADAVAAERERCALLCENYAGLRSTGAWMALTAATDRIRAASDTDLPGMKAARTLTLDITPEKIAAVEARLRATHGDDE